MHNIFFELIQVALGTRDRLSQTPTEKEWQELYDLCQKQSVVGITFAVLDKLSKYGQKPPLKSLYEWIALAEQVKQQNRIVNQNAVLLCKELENDRFECCILKGQGNATLYDVGSKKEVGRCLALLRTPGDIDVWVRPKEEDVVSPLARNYTKSDSKFIKNVIGYVKGRNPKGNACYHHIDFGMFNGTEVEVHYRPSFMFNPIHNYRLQQWFSKMADGGCVMAELPERAGTIRIPNKNYNIVFQLSHVYNHLLHEGIGLRQIIDYYYLLKSNTFATPHSATFRSENCTDYTDISRIGEFENKQPTNTNCTNVTNYQETLQYLGLEKIAGAMMWVLNEKLGLSEEYLIAPKDQRRGTILLEEIMKGGNFGFYDIENQKANSRLKKNIQRVKRDLRMMRYFPSECLWEPIFRTYHFFWRMKYN